MQREGHAPGLDIWITHEIVAWKIEVIWAAIAHTLCKRFVDSKQLNVYKQEGNVSGTLGSLSFWALQL